LGRIYACLPNSTVAGTVHDPPIRAFGRFRAEERNKQRRGFFTSPSGLDWPRRGRGVAVGPRVPGDVHVTVADPGMWAGMRCAPREGSGPLSATPSTLVPGAAAPFRRRLSFSVPVACGPRPHAHASGDERRRSEREDGRPKLVLQRDEFYSFEMLFDRVFVP